MADAQVAEKELTVKFHAERAELAMKISTLEQGTSEAVAEEQQKQSDLWQMTLAVEGELTRVEGELAAMKNEQASLTKDYITKKAELTREINLLKTDLESAIAGSEWKDSHYLSRIEDMEASAEKVRQSGGRGVRRG